MVFIKRCFLISYCLPIVFIGFFYGCTSTPVIVEQDRIKSMTQKESIVWGYIDTSFVLKDGTPEVVRQGLISLIAGAKAGNSVSGLGTISINFKNIQTYAIHKVVIMPGSDDLFSILLPEGEYKFFIDFKEANFPIDEPPTFTVASGGKAIYIGDIYMYQAEPHIRFKDKFDKRLLQFKSLHPSFNGECVKRWVTLATGSNLP